MSGMEIILIIGAVLVPIIALLMVLPKKLKQVKQKVETKQIEQKDEPLKQEKLEQKPKLAEKEQTKTPLFDNTGYKQEDFADYLKEKSKKSVQPKKKELPNDFKDLSQGYEDFLHKTATPTKTLADDVVSLSPELQAMIFAGLLDKKF